MSNRSSPANSAKDSPGFCTWPFRRNCHSSSFLSGANCFCRQSFTPLKSVELMSPAWLTALKGASSNSGSNSFSQSSLGSFTSFAYNSNLINHNGSHFLVKTFSVVEHSYVSKLIQLSLLQILQTWPTPNTNVTPE